MVAAVRVVGATNEYEGGAPRKRALDARERINSGDQLCVAATPHRAKNREVEDHSPPPRPPAAAPLPARRYKLLFIIK